MAKFQSGVIIALMQTSVHSELGPVRYQLREIGSNPDAQVAQTIELMRARAKEDAQHPWFRSRAARLLSGGSETDQVARAHAHTKQSIRFQQDEDTGGGIRGLELHGDELIEVIMRPLDMATYVDNHKAVGDCDDFSMYVACLLEAVGIPCGFVTVAADPRDPSQYSHVYAVAYPRDEFGRRVRVPIDASHGEYAGWEVADRFGKFREWPVSSFWGDMFTGVLGSLAAIWVYHQWRTGAFA